MEAAAILDFIHFYAVDGRIIIKFGTLVQNDTCSKKHGQNHHFRKNKMAAATIWDFGKIAITSPMIE